MLPRVSDRARDGAGVTAASPHDTSGLGATFPKWRDDAQGAGAPASSMWRDPVLWAVMAAALAYRITLLATTCAHAHADEAIVGVMARHILDGGERPLFYYGQSYGGGGALEAYAAALAFALFGESTAALKLAPLLFSIATIPATYWVARRVSVDGRLGARLVILFLVVAPPTFEWSIAARGGYVETMFFSMLLAFIAWPALAGPREGDAVSEPRLSTRRWLLLGAVAGFAFYVFGLIAPAIVTLGAFLLAARAVTRRSLAAMGGGFLLGAAPIIYENVRHRFVNVRHLLSSPGSDGVVGRLRDVAAHVARLLTHDLPAFFTPWIDDFVTEIPLYAWVLCAATSALCVVHVLATRDRWRPAWRAIARRGAERTQVDLTPLLPIVYVAIYALLYAGSRFAGVTPRYLLALYPMLAILAASGAAWLIRSPARARRLAGWTLACAIGVLGLAHAGLFIGPATTREYNVETRGESVPALIALLERESVGVVFATPPIKWKILWEGRERILAATHFLPQEDWFRRPQLEQDAIERAAWGDEPAAFVTHAAFAYERAWGTNEVRSLLASRERWEDALAARGVTYRRERAGDYFVYWGFSKNVPRLLLAREFYVKGKHFVETGHAVEAIKNLERARALDPEDPEIERLLERARGR
jgi:4-amino-4-deoxy-L-arabinose transferase-like glycosyltransferase